MSPARPIAGAPRNPGDHRALWVLVAALLGGGALYHAKGIALLSRPGGGGDGIQRWQEVRYVLAGRNPYDATYATFGVGRAPNDPTRSTSPLPSLEVPDSGGYPPWAFASGVAFFGVGRSATKPTFLAISLGLTAATAAWAWRAARPPGGGAEAGWLGVASVLGIAAYSTCCHVGQYGGVVVGLLALSAWCLQGGFEVAGGLLLGVALLKPTIAGPFALILLWGGRWRALASCVAYVGAASLLVWGATRTDPVEMLLQMLAAGADFVDDSQGLIGLLRRAGLTPKQVTPVLALAVLVPGAILLLACRRRPLVVQFAAAAVVGRLWAYHKFYDNMMMCFLLVALARAACSRWSALAWAGFLVAGTVTWSPSSLWKAEAAVLAQVAAWIFGLVALLATPASPPPGAGPRPEGAR